ncbi:phosphoribosyltransferase [Halalkalicoccus sp. GCM10025322]|uniref:phosphoribosyltransferase n=1 Tax=Halalkalicoccus TaxID=332246 RepID=UPI002F96A52E
MTRTFSRFADRTDAGEHLADLLERRGIAAESVLAIPRGGLPVARVVADALDLPLDVVVARKLGAPTNPELAIGAVAADGSLWLNDALIDRLGVDGDYVDRTADREAENARRKRERYRGTPDPAPTEGGTVLVVDDGIATGATTIACVRQARAAGADRVIVAVPVAPPDVIERLREEADDVIAVITPSSFGAVGRFYESFEQVSDEEAMDYLDEGER